MISTRPKFKSRRSWWKELNQADILKTVIQKYCLPLPLNRCPFSEGEKQKGQEQALMHRMNGKAEYGARQHHDL